MSGWHVRVLSYRGIVPRAVHYLALLRPDDGSYTDEVEITRELTAEEIASNPSDWVAYRPGDDTTRFLDRDALTAAIHAKFLELAAPGDVLYDCSPIFVERVAVLVKEQPS